MRITEINMLFYTLPFILFLISNKILPFIMLSYLHVFQDLTTYRKYYVNIIKSIEKLQQH